MDSFSFSFSSCLFLCIFQKRFLSATVNCPRRSSDPERLRDLELWDLDLDFEPPGLTECLPFALDFDRRRDVDRVLLTERRFDRLLERDFRFVFRLDLDDRRGGVDELDELEERDLEGRGLLDAERLRFECRGAGDMEGEREPDLDRDFELDNILLYVFGGVKELSLNFLAVASVLSLYFLCSFGGGV